MNRKPSWKKTHFSMKASAWVLALATSSCSPASAPPRHIVGGESGSLQISDSENDYGEVLRTLILAAPGSEARGTALRRFTVLQLKKVARLNVEQSSEKGTAALAGAFALQRTDELDVSVLRAQISTLRQAADDVSKRGQSGRALALYSILDRTASDVDTKEHLAALVEWSASLHGSALKRAGGLATSALQRAVIENTKETKADAEKKVIEWISRAVALRSGRNMDAFSSREEISEMYRALGLGGKMLIGLHLRDANPKAALDAVGRASARSLVDDKLVRALEVAATSKVSASDWTGLLRAFLSDKETEYLDRDLVASVVLQLACEAYRADPKSAEAVTALASSLYGFGMADAVPSVLQEIVATSDSTDLLASAVPLLHRSIAYEALEGDRLSARRAFRDSLPILAHARSAKVQSDPSPDAVYELMADAEIRDGNAREAKALFLEVQAKGMLSSEGLIGLSKIALSDGDKDAALSSLRTAYGRISSSDALAFSRIALAEAEVVRASDPARATQQLMEALRRVRSARADAEKGRRMRLERQLAAIQLELGAVTQAESSVERLLASSIQKVAEVAAEGYGMLLQNALLSGDVARARKYVERAMGSGVSGSDKLYLCAWLRLAEIEKGLPEGDGAKRCTVDREEDRWATLVFRFVSGRVSEAELRKGAGSSNQRTEADFYPAALRRAKREAFEIEMQKVVRSPSVDLSEVALARRMLPGWKRLNVQIPRELLE